MDQVVDGVYENVLLSSPGMHEMAESIMPLLMARGARFSHQRISYTTFANGEIKPQIPETVRGMHAFFLHPLQHPDPNTALMSMFFTCDALTRGSVAGITLVLPYIPYLRQDRKDKPRVPISARVIADLIESNPRVDRLITLDMHADQEQGFFSIPVDNLSGSVVHAEYFRKRFNNDFSNVVVVAPDFGSAVRARRFAARLDESVPVSIIDKRRPGPNKVQVIGFVGESVADRNVILYDDMIDTGGTIRAAVGEILKRGARSACICVTHALFSEDAEESFVKERHSVIVTQSIPRLCSYWRRHEAWLEAVSIDELLAGAMHEASTIGGSLSKLSK